MSEFKDKLKELRIKNGFTQKKLADLLHVSQNAVYNWESGKREPSLDTLLKIATILHVSIDELLGDFRIFKSQIIEESPVLSYLEKNDQLSNTFWEEYLQNAIIEKLDITEDKQRLIFEYNKLNPMGKEEALKRIQELAEIVKYRQDPPKSDEFESLLSPIEVNEMLKTFEHAIKKVNHRNNSTEPEDNSFSNLPNRKTSSSR